MVSLRIRGIIKSNLKAMTVDKGLAAMKGSMANKLTFGASSLISDVKAIKSAKGVGKAIPGVSLAAGLFEVGVGTVTTDDIAQKNGSCRCVCNGTSGCGSCWCSRWFTSKWISY